MLHVFSLLPLHRSSVFVARVQEDPPGAAPKCRGGEARQNELQTHGLVSLPQSVALGAAFLGRVHSSIHVSLLPGSRFAHSRHGPTTERVRHSRQVQIINKATFVGSHLPGGELMPSGLYLVRLIGDGAGSV